MGPRWDPVVVSGIPNPAEGEASLRCRTSATLALVLLLAACAPEQALERRGEVPGAVESAARIGPRDGAPAPTEQAALEGRLLLEQELAGPLLRIAVFPSGARPPAATLAEGRVQDDGTFRLEGLAPGTVDLGVSTLGAKRLAHVVEGIELVAGATTHDPRLAAIDLRGRLRALSFDVVDAGGRPSSGVLLDVFYPEQAPGTCAATLAYPRDRVTLLVEKTHVDLRLRVRDCRVTWVRGAEEPEHVAMQPLLKLRLRLATRLDLGPGRVLRPLVRFEGTPAAPPPRQAVEKGFDERGEFALEVGEPGRYTVAYELAVEKSPGLRPSRELELEPEILEVLDVDPEQVFPVDVPKAAVAQALEALR